MVTEHGPSTNSICPGHVDDIVEDRTRTVHCGTFDGGVGVVSTGLDGHARGPDDDWWWRHARRRPSVSARNPSFLRGSIALTATFHASPSRSRDGRGNGRLLGSASVAAGSDQASRPAGGMFLRVAGQVSDLTVPSGSFPAFLRSICLSVASIARRPERGAAGPLWAVARAFIQRHHSWLQHSTSVGLVAKCRQSTLLHR